MDMGFIAVFVILIAVGAGIYFFKRKEASSSGSTTVPPSYVGQWTAAYGKNIPSPLPKDAQGNPYFDYPKTGQGSVHYIYTSPGTLNDRPQLGKTIKLRFRLDGAGVAHPVAGSDTDPATVRLFMQRSGDDLGGKDAKQFYRWFLSRPLNLVGTGEFELTAPIDRSVWGPVGGDQYVRPANYEEVAQAGFEDCIANLVNIGWCHGGRSFAGHGQDADGDLRLTLLEYSIS